MQRPITGKAADILASIKEDVKDEVADKIEQLVRAITDEAITTRVAPVEGRVNEFAKSAQEQAEERYVRSLEGKVADWKKYAGTPEYGEFLATRDEVTGATMYDLAQSALQSLDATRMAAIYDRYKQLKGIKPVAAAVKTDGERVVPKGKEALITPRGTVRTAERTDVGDEKPDYITYKQMEQWAKSMKDMSEAEETKLQARIDRAIQKGWIVP